VLQKILIKSPKVSSSKSHTFSQHAQGYIYELDDAMKTKIHFPKNDKQELGLVQHFLVLQLFIPEGVPFSLEIVISDTTKVL